MIAVRLFHGRVLIAAVNALGLGPIL